MSLTIWVDIFRVIIVVCLLIFAHIYHEIREVKIVLRLFQLMRYKDRIIFVIFKIACLEKLKNSDTINYIQLYSRIIALSIILNNFKLAFESNNLYFLDDVLILNLLFENICHFSNYFKNPLLWYDRLKE